MSFLSRITPLTCLRLSTVFKQLQSKNICFSTRQCPRLFSSLPPRIRPLSSGKELSLKLKDDVPEEYELIYRAPMENYVSVAKNVSTATTTLVAILVSYKLASDLAFIDMPHEVNFAGLVSHESDIWVFGAGFLAINLVIRFFVAKYPLRIYKSVDEYIAVYDSQLPLRSSKHYFRKGQASVVPPNFLNPWSGSFYRLGQRSSLLLISHFRTPSEFHQMFGST